MQSENKLSPICCFVGHVDVGKTSLLDMLRGSKVQNGEVGRITQQIGSTYFNKEALCDIAEELSNSLEISSLLIIDTPGHDCFTQMRLIGIKASHLPILIVDIIKGLEPQTRKCIELLKKYNTQFVVALNKLDRVAGWKSSNEYKRNLKLAFSKQSCDTVSLVKHYAKNIVCQLAEQEINAALYYENKNFKNTISMVPISAKTGEGIPDLIVMISKLTTRKLARVMRDQNSLYNHCFGYIMETRQDEKHGLIVYGLLLTNELHRGDEILAESVDGTTVVATVKDILLPPDLKEMKNKVSFKSVKSIGGTCGIGIKFTDDKIYDEIVGGGLFMLRENGRHDLLEIEIKKYADMHEDFNFENTGIIVNVPAKGMAYALLKLLQIRDKYQDLFGD